LSRLLPVAAVTVGAVLIVVGVALWSVPAALIVSGLAFAVAGVFYRYEEN